MFDACEGNIARFVIDAHGCYRALGPVAITPGKTFDVVISGDFGTPIGLYLSYDAYEWFLSKEYPGTTEIISETFRSFRYASLRCDAVAVADLPPGVMFGIHA